MSGKETHGASKKNDRGGKAKPVGRIRVKKGRKSCKLTAHKYRVEIFGHHFSGGAKQYEGRLVTFGKRSTWKTDDSLSTKLEDAIKQYNEGIKKKRERNCKAGSPSIEDDQWENESLSSPVKTEKEDNNTSLPSGSRRVIKIIDCIKCCRNEIEGFTVQCENSYLAYLSKAEMLEEDAKMLVDYLCAKLAEQKAIQ